MLFFIGSPLAGLFYWGQDMTDFASIGVKMETEPVARGIKTLEQLAATGPKVERSMSGVEQAASKANKSLKGLGDGADKGLNAVGTAAPRAEQSLGRVAKNADEAKRSIAEMNRSASGLNAALRGDHLVRGFSGIETGATAAASAVSHLNYMLALTGAGISINSLIGWADGYTKLTAQLRNATDSAQDYAYAMEQVKRISEGAQAGIGELGVLYARIASSTKELGISQAQVAKITETVALSLKANGASAAEASSAMLQLSQAFGSGVLRGEEFNAVYEAAPNLLRNLADAMGVPQGKLREMASDGKLTAEVLAKYLPESLEKVRKEAERMATIGGAFTVLNNKIMEFVGEANQASGAAKAISGGIVGLANNLDTVATAAGVVALVMAGRYTASMATAAAASVAAATAAVQHQIAMARTAAAIGGYSATTTAGLVAMTGAARAASLAMGALGGPVGLAVTAIGLGAAAFYSFGDSADVAKEKVASLLDPLDELTAKLSALPAEKRVAVTLDLKEEQQRAVEVADAAVDALIQSVGDLTNMRLPTGEWNDLRDRVEAAAKSGQDLTPILQNAAKSASVPAEQLNQWITLAGNLRVAQAEAVELKRKLDELTGRNSAGGGRGGSYHPLSLGIGETASEFDKRTGAALNAQVKAALEASKSYKSLSERMGEVRQEGEGVSVALKALEQAGRGTSKEANQLRDRLKGVDEKLKSMAKSGAASAGGVKASESAILSYIKSLEARTAAQRLEIAQGDKLTESQRARIQLEALLADSKNKASKSQVANAQALLAESEANEAWLKNASDVEKALADMQKAREQSLRSVQDSVKKLVEEAEATAYAEMHNISLAEAVERLALARAENAYQQAVERQEAPATLAALEAELQARKKIVELTAQKGVKEANDKAQEEIKKGWERTSQTIGDTLADYIMGGGKDAAQYLKRLFATLVLQPIVNYGVQGVLGAIGMGGGAAGGSNAMGMLNNLSSLNTMYSAFSGGLTNSVGTAFSKAGQLFGSEALKSFGVGTQGAYLPAGVQGPVTGGSGAGIGASGVAAVAAVVAGMIASNKLFDAGFSANNFSSQQKTWDFGTYYQTKIASNIFGEKWANILSGAPLGNYIWGKFDNSGTSHMGAGAIYEGGKLQEGAGIYNQGVFGMGQAKEYSSSAQSAISGIAAQAGATLESIAKAFGLDGGYRVATAFADDSSKDGAWGTLKIADALGNVLVDWERTRTSKWAPKVFSDGEAGYQEYLNAVQADVLTAIKAMDLPGWAKDMFAAAQGAEGLQSAMQGVGVVLAQFDLLGQSMSMFTDLSGSVQTTLLSVSGGIDALVTNAGSFYDNFYSEQERLDATVKSLAETFSKYGAELPTTAEQYRALVEQQMAAGDAGAEFAAVLLGLSGTFKSVADAWSKDLSSMSASVTDFFSDLMASITALSADVQSSRKDILRGTAVMSVDEIRDAIAGVSITRPGLDAVNSAEVDVITSAAAAASAKAASDAAAKASADALTNLTDAKNDPESAAAKLAAAQQRKQHALSEAAKFEDGGMYRGYSYGTRVKWMNYWYPKANEAQQEIEALKPALEAYEASLADLQAQYDASKISAENYAQKLADAEAILAAAQKADTQTKVDFAAQVAQFVTDAAGSVDKLSDLRGEVVSFYEAQVQAAQSMLQSAGNIRGVVDQLRLGQLTTAQTAAELGNRYATDYAMALATTGSTRAGYVDSMAGNLGSLTEALKAESVTGADWRIETAKLFAQANNAAGLLQGDAESDDYKDVALGLLDSIDTALAGLSGSTKSAEQVIADAINSGTQSQLEGLRAIVAALQGQPIPAFAVGTNYVPRDMVAQIHEGEAIVPKAFNPWAGGGMPSGGGNTAALIAEIRELREDQRAQASKMVQLQQEMNRVLARWDSQGMPEEREVA